MCILWIFLYNLSYPVFVGQVFCLLFEFKCFKNILIICMWTVLGLQKKKKLVVKNRTGNVLIRRIISSNLLAPEVGEVLCMVNCSFVALWLLGVYCLILIFLYNCVDIYRP